MTSPRIWYCTDAVISVDQMFPHLMKMISSMHTHTLSFALCNYYYYLTYYFNSIVRQICFKKTGKLHFNTFGTTFYSFFFFCPTNFFSSNICIIESLHNVQCAMVANENSRNMLETNKSINFKFDFILFFFFLFKYVTQNSFVRLWHFCNLLFHLWEMRMTRYLSVSLLTAYPSHFNKVDDKLLPMQK